MFTAGDSDRMKNFQCAGCPATIPGTQRAFTLRDQKDPFDGCMLDDAAIIKHMASEHGRDVTHLESDISGRVFAFERTRRGTS